MSPEQADANASTAIGPYRVLDTLGEGGMGTVYLAEQSSPVKRRVALELIKLGMDSKAVVARFRQEEQALALMQHDGIARVYDCGTSDRGQHAHREGVVHGPRARQRAGQRRRRQAAGEDHRLRSLDFAVALETVLGGVDAEGAPEIAPHEAGNAARGSVARVQWGRMPHAE